MSRSSLIEQLISETPLEIRRQEFSLSEGSEINRAVKSAMKIREVKEVRPLELYDASVNLSITLLVKPAIMEIAKSNPPQAVFSERDAIVVIEDPEDRSVELLTGPAAPALAFRLIENFLEK